MIRKLLTLPVWGLLLVLAIVAIIILFTFSSLNPLNPLNFINQPEVKIDLSRTSVVKEIQSLNRLETASYTIEKIIEAGTDGNVFQEILYGDRLLLIAHGKVTAGVDLSKVQEDEVRISGDTLEIAIPAPEIFSVSLDNAKTKVYDRDQGFLSGGNKDLESQARQSAEESIRQAACQSNILNEAANNAKSRISDIYSLVGFQHITVSVPVGSC